ncbi:MAG TPA: hypothetical protein VK427_19550, partial [Kofleriaceae bacterium]|nr:hypothetical protein [Kofleriaceae bacterium]
MERDLVAVWIALAKPAAVKLDVFRGVGPRSTLDAPIAAVTHPVATGRRGIPPDQHTLAFGANLHVAMALFEPAAPASLEWGTVYSYDLRLTADDDGAEVGLLELGLLGNEPVTNRLGVAQPHLALGYTVGFLPSFATPASRPLELKIAHGSCRWASGEGKDGMAIVDELIGASLANATQRPQMLWLTGDQIYADAVAPELGRICIDLGSWLLGDQLVNEHLKVDVLDDSVSPALPVTHEYKLDLDHFPPGRRGHLVASAGFTSVKQDSHLIGFGEYAATYINGWSNVTWPALEPMLQARFADVQAFVADYQELRADLKKARERRELPAEEYEELRDLWSAWHLVPIELRSLHGQLTEGDRWEEWGESNVSSGG